MLANLKGGKLKSMSQKWDGRSRLILGITSILSLGLIEQLAFAAEPLERLSCREMGAATSCGEDGICQSDILISKRKWTFNLRTMRYSGPNRSGRIKRALSDPGFQKMIKLDDGSQVGFFSTTSRNVLITFSTDGLPKAINLDCTSHP